MHPGAQLNLIQRPNVPPNYNFTPQFNPRILGFNQRPIAPHTAGYTFAIQHPQLIPQTSQNLTPPNIHILAPQHSTPISISIPTSIPKNIPKSIPTSIQTNIQQPFKQPFPPNPNQRRRVRYLNQGW